MAQDARQDKFLELQEKKAEEKKEEAADARPAEAPGIGSAGAKPEPKAAAKKKEERKEEKKDEKKEKKREVVLERVYAVNFMRAYAKPKMKRADYATRMLRAFLERHMKSPADKIRISPALNEAMRARGSGHPLKKVKLKATKDKEGLVLAELAA